MKNKMWESIFLNKYICLASSEIPFCGSFVSKEHCHKCIHSFIYDMPLKRKIKLYLKLSMLEFKHKLMLKINNILYYFRIKNNTPF